MTYSSYGPTKTHGYAVLPSQRPSTLSFYTLTVSGNITSESTVVNGAFDILFRDTLSNFATVAMIGTPVYNSPNTTLNFAIEDTGADSLSTSGLGLGNVESGTTSTTALALTALVQALGNSVGVNSKDLSAATVTAGVNGAAF
jgi:hypothetical protein